MNNLRRIVELEFLLSQERSKVAKNEKDVSDARKIIDSKTNMFNSNISFSFQHLVHGYVMNIIDKADVHQLRNVMSETKEIVYLYLEVFEGWVEHREAVDKFVPYNVENIVSDNVEECTQEETVAVNTME
uniref:Uncharacterized protein n=1 Tax=Lactuca sativa TaxID=4236 RepID=A0A9R1VBK2_LACSA|nr:hypothetical protein LSAT_V11C500252650 [Lactuca sativa]